MVIKMSNFNSEDNLLDNVLVVAITGAINSGKSEVSKILYSLGYRIISTDLLSKQILSTSPEVKNLIKSNFGDESFINNSYNTKFISEQVFGNTELSRNNLQKLNAILHPPVIDLMIKTIEEYALVGEKLIFVESALIFEAGLDEGFDYIIMIDCKEEIRKGRFIKNTNLSEIDFKYRNDSQLNPQYKREHSDFVIENNSNLENLQRSVLSLLEIIKLLPKKQF